MMACKIPFKLSFLSLLWRPVICGIIGPTHLNCSVGDHAYFRWNANNKSTIVSATWGIKRGNVPDPQYITVDIRRNKAHLNMDLEPNIRKRLSFDGDLKRGWIWFCLRNVTLDDTNEYLASIFDSDTNVEHLAVALTVKEHKREKNEIDRTSEQSHSFAATPSMAPRVPRITTAKEAQVNATNGPHMTVRPDAIGASTIIAAVLLPLLVILALAVLVAIVFCKKSKPWTKRKGTTASEKGLMEANAIPIE